MREQFKCFFSEHITEEAEMNPTELPPPAQLMNFIVGKWISKPIYVAAELGIADMLGEGPRSIEQLASACRCHSPSLYRMMRALASVGIFRETDGRRFELTPMAGCLKTGLLRSVAILFNADWSDRAWGHFMESVKTGTTAFERAFGMPLADWLEKNPGTASVFHEANAVKAAGSHRAIVDVYDFSGIGTLTDVGGGTGALMAEILIANPPMTGCVADLPSVVRDTAKQLRSRGLEDRCNAVACDFFREIPAGSDAYLLSHVLHDWPDDRCRTILENCRKAMTPSSKLLIVEMVVLSGNEPSIAKLLDLEMMVMTGGCERTEAEFKWLLESSGFKLSRIIPTRESICVMEGMLMT